jgi:SAM-dependent methyltransferase
MLTSCGAAIDTYAGQLQQVVTSNFRRVCDQVNAEITEATKEFFVPGHKDFMLNIEYDRGRNLLMPDSLVEALLGKIRRHTDWHYPGLEIGPRDGQYTKYLVGCDPLYLVDVHEEYLVSSIQQFPPEYQARVRPYCIGFQKNERGLSDLPQNEFGFVFSWNFFNYVPFDEIKPYIADVAKVLRPGGTFLFGYNDGDMYNGARHVEWGSMVYTPKSLLIPLIESFGLEIVDSVGEDYNWHNVSWLEVRKPGVLTTIKAHQTLGAILNKQN